MATLELTKTTVESLTAGERDVYAWDTELRRFGLRLTPPGARIYLVQYRSPTDLRRTRRVIIGRHGDPWTAETARKAARVILAQVDLGRDPFADREHMRESARRAEEAEKLEALAAQERRFELIAERYIGAVLTAKRSGQEAGRHLRRGPIATWEGRQIGTIRRADVADLIASIRERSPATARLTYAALRGLFSWCIERELVEVSPCDHVRAPARPPARDRVLADEELRAIWQGADALGHPFGPIIKLMMLTGQREAEVAGMTWDEIDLDASTWTLPKGRTKNGREHAVDLSPQVLAIIRAVPKAGLFLFPARNAPARKHVRPEGEPTVRPVAGFSAAKRILDGDVTRKTKAMLPTAKLAHWRFHDLRRTAATGMAGMGFTPHVVERVLNHASGVTGGLVGVYQRHEYRPERRAALEAWGEHVAAVVEGRKPTSNVVTMADARAKAAR
jgi:integrase